MRVLELCVLPEEKKIRLDIQMPDPDRYLTSQVPHLPRLLFQLIPRLSQHSCDNGAGLTFRQECRNTEIPHLLEHLIIELQLQAQQRPTDLLRGETEWNWTIGPRGRYQVTVEYDNELLAVASIRLAERILHSLDRREVDIDMDAEVAYLHQVMLLGEKLADEPKLAERPSITVVPKIRARRTVAPARRRMPIDMPLVGVS